MLTMVLDIALLLVSGSACLYCWVLSKRLKALQDLKKGLGASIVSLSEAISKTSVAAQEAKMSAATSADKLARLLGDIDKAVPVVDDLIESINRSTRRAANETTRMQDDAIASVKPLLADAKKTAGSLAAVLQMVNERSRELKAEIKELETRKAAMESEVIKLADQANDVRVDDKLTAMPADEDENPFSQRAERLRALSEKCNTYTRAVTPAADTAKPTRVQPARGKIGRSA